MSTDPRAVPEPGRLLVQFAPGWEPAEAPARSGHLVTGDAQLDDLQARAGVHASRRTFRSAGNALAARASGLDRWYSLEIDPGADPEAVAREWAAHPGVESACADYVATSDLAPNDSLFAMQWGHDNVGQMPDYCDGCGGHDGGAPVGTAGFDAGVLDAWSAAGRGDSSVVIAFVDTGVDLNHPDLSLLSGWDFFDDDSTANDYNGHGTMVAGILGAIADNGIGSAGVAPECGLLPVKTGGTASERAAGITWAADQGADVINMSWTIYYVLSHGTLDAALDYASAAGCLLVSSSGNRNESTLWLPQSRADVMAVGAASPCGERKRSSDDPGKVNGGYQTDPNGVSCDNEVWWGSNYGTAVADDPGAVDLLAPIILPTTFWGDTWENWFSGTSCAAPFVSAVAALVMSHEPTWSASQVWSALTSTATDITNIESGVGFDRYAGHGLVNAHAALMSGSVSVPALPGASRGELAVAADPSPFQGRTRISWTSPRDATVQVAVFDAAGRRVRTLVNDARAAGEHGVEWDGRDSSGADVVAGIYFARVQVGDVVQTRKITRVR